MRGQLRTGRAPVDVDQVEDDGNGQEAQRAEARHVGGKSKERLCHGDVEGCAGRRG